VLAAPAIITTYFEKNKQDHLNNSGLLHAYTTA